MENKKFLLKKTEIVKRYTGASLLPAEQVKNIPVTKEMVVSMMSYLGATSPRPLLLTPSNCVYCVSFDSSTTYMCSGCPMEMGNNRCSLPDSSFSLVDKQINSLSQKEKDSLEAELVELAQRYVDGNKQLLN